ncbi:MAG: hypothetical protein ABH919_02325 [bacterium]
MKKVDALRKKYPRFVYKKYSYEKSGNDLIISFIFETGDLRFAPQIKIKNAGPLPTIDNLVFNLGLIESLSYWKATGSPEIIIEAGNLNKEQIKWWQDLIKKGMGQFFYENKINFKNFVKITCPGKDKVIAPLSRNLKKRTLIPLGDGKDSLTTLNIIKEPTACFSLNPTATTGKILQNQNSIIVDRKIDPNLLELNRKGYLNGHTPFSAYLAFLTVLCGVVFDYKYIALSNERSANEGNTEYLGETINHQYSKTFSFEKKFRSYCRKYLSTDIEYFSFLRPLYEIQIAKIFSQFKQYHSLFLSCNEAKKTYSGTKKTSNHWCGNCSKCLFVYAILYPFLPKEEMIKIFGQDFFMNKKLLPVMRDLIEPQRVKPWECVGTREESLIAFYLSWKKSPDSILLKYWGENIRPQYSNLEKRAERILHSWNKQHNLPQQFSALLDKNSLI